jgi:lipid-A-disaccharide synthase
MVQHGWLAMSCDLFVFAGEVSGDLHGGPLLESLLKLRPDLKIAGVCGPKMRPFATCVMPMEKFQVMGFVDVILALPKLARQFFQVRNAILELQPKLVLLIDYPGFNLRMAASLRKKGFKGKIVHYICPSVWAWGKKRIPHMAKTLDALLTIFPFEAKLFEKTPLEVIYVGHPLTQKIPPRTRPHQTPKRIALFPGSREKEIRRNFPLQLEVAKRLLQENPSLTFTTSIADPRFSPLLHTLLAEANVPCTFTSDSQALMQQADFAIAKSGTVTLELALHVIPTVVIYAISKLDTFIAGTILRIHLPFYCIVNIVMGKEVFPELIGPQLTPETLYTTTKSLLANPAPCIADCTALRHHLHATSPSTAAEAVLTLLGKED